MIKPTRPGELTRGNRLAARVIILMMGIFFGAFLSPINAKANSQGVASIYEDGIPVKIRIYCEVIGNEFDICPELLEAMAYHESRFTVDATNGKHKGLMQVNTEVHAERLIKYGYTESDMTSNAYANILVAADYLAELYETYGDENPIVLSVYSGNWKAVSDYKEYGWLCPYVNDVLTRSYDYERVHGK